MTPTEPDRIEPDTKDWTFVITDGCAECGFDPSFDVASTGALLRDSLPRWRARLAADDIHVRPAQDVWSPLEYACHARDTSRVFRGRLELMLSQDDPTFDDWDQDLAAVEGEYFAQDPTRVADELTREGEATAALFDQVTGDQWQRPGRRSNGSVFTIETFARYFIHDVQHHLVDVSA